MSRPERRARSALLIVAPAPTPLIGLWSQAYTQDGASGVLVTDDWKLR